ncbi:MAG: hypothetical protein GXO29_05090 [Thermotogae bacterium]|nr:hypothetical protein [Thermotogota bacterium]
MEHRIRFDELRLALEEFANRHGVDSKRVGKVLEAALKRTFEYKYRYAHPKPQVDAQVDLDKGEVKVILTYPDGSKEPEVIYPTDLSIDDVHTLKNYFVQMIKYDIQKSKLSKIQSYIGKIVTGKVQKVDRKRGVLLGVSVGDVDVEGRIEPSGMVKDEIYRPGQDIEAVVLSIEERSNYPLVLSRAHPSFVRALLEKIPEVADGTVQIRAIAREAGVMTKVAVSSTDSYVSPVTALLGKRGMRLMTVRRRLPKNEQIEVVQYDPDKVRFAVLALSPAENAVAAYETEDEIRVYYENEDDLGRAKGKEGLNVILASRLVGKKIMALPISEYEPPEEGITLYDIKDKLPPQIYEKMKKAALVYFRKLPPLVHIQRLLDVDEATAIRVLDVLEEALREKAQSRLRKTQEQERDEEKKEIEDNA